MGALVLPNDAIRESVVALRRLANYRLPVELDRRIIDLSERKEQLSISERDEFQAWVQFTQERSIEKFGAQAALKQLSVAYPELLNE